jgi:RimJ/RimL family protein N-acetyltransferase
VFNDVFEFGDSFFESRILLAETLVLCFECAYSFFEFVEAFKEKENVHGRRIAISNNEGKREQEKLTGTFKALPYWGQGLIPEAVHELLRHAFEDLGLSAIWAGYADGNEKSKRVQEKCGFTYHHTEYDKHFPLIDAVRTVHFTMRRR